MTYGMPVGTIIAYGGKVTMTALKKLEKDGWLFCNGDAKSDDDYRDLYAAIGSSFGSPGTGKFNLPNLRGQFLRGVSGSTTNDSDKKARTPLMEGGNSGNAVGSLQNEQCNSVDKFNTSNTKSTWGQGKPKVIPDNKGWSDYLCTGAWKAAGSGSIRFIKKGIETRPTNVYVHYLIKCK